MNHIVASLMCHLQPILPLFKWPEGFCQHRLTPDTIHLDSVIHLAGIDDRIHQEIAGTVGIFHRVTRICQQQNMPEVLYTNSLDERPQHVTYAPSLPIFRSCLEIFLTTHEAAWYIISVLSVCQTITFVSLAIGSLFSLIWHISRSFIHKGHRVKVKVMVTKKC